MNKRNIKTLWRWEVSKCSECKHLTSLCSNAGWYIGTTLEHEPYCRASKYFSTREEADEAIRSGFELRDSLEVNAVNEGLIACEVCK